MTRGSRIIRFTFWLNSLSIIVLAFGFTLAILDKTTRWGTLPSLLILLYSGLVSFESWYLKRFLRVSSMENYLYFVDDERERSH